MRNSVDQYQKTKEHEFQESLDKKLAQDLRRKDDDGIESQPEAQDSDCWIDLWRRIKAKGAQFFNRNK